MSEWMIWMAGFAVGFCLFAALDRIIEKLNSN